MPKQIITSNFTDSTTCIQTNNTRVFTIIHQNVRSITSKTGLLNILLNKYNPEVLVCSETWCRYNAIQRVGLCGYELANSFCRTTIEHGGVALYAREGLVYKQRNDLQSLAVEFHCEFSIIEMYIEKLIIVGIYRTGKGDFDIFLSTIELLLSKLIDENKRFILVGDQNVDYLTDNSQKRLLNNLLSSYNSKNIIDFATRICDDCSTSLECGIVARDDCDVTGSSLDTAISDHMAQMFLLTFSQPSKVSSNPYVQRRMFTKESIYLFFLDISNYNWTFINNNEIDINDKFAKLIRILTYYIDIHFPYKNMLVKRKNSTPWLSEELGCYLKQFDDFCEIRRQYPQNEMINKCISYYSDLIKSVSLRDRRSYTDTRLKTAKNPSKEVWRIVNEEIGTGSKLHNVCLSGQGGDVPAAEIPDRFNNHFLTVASKFLLQNDHLKALKYLNQHLCELHVPDLTLPVVTHASISKILRSMLKTANTLDIYDITVNILLSIWPVISHLLVSLINEMFIKGTYPDVLKSTRVCPVYKGKGDKTQVDSHRPITIVPNISKIVESIISMTIMNHFETNDLLTDRQYAYRKDKSTTAAAHQITDTILTCIDDKYKTAGIFCDLTKAFDVIENSLLLAKLNKYGIKNKVHQLLKSFLSNRKQTVEVTISGQKVRSEPGDVTVGIPQGSSLGNTLFLAFINDLPRFVTDGLIVLFADDTTVIVCSHTYEQLNEKINIVCDQLREWFASNGLVLNMTKSNVMLFSGRPIPTPLCINSPIPLSEKCKFLGFTLDPNMNWKPHVNSLCDRLSGAAYALRKLRPVVSDRILRQTYFAHFHSLMSYGAILWGNSTESNSVFILQKRAIRILAGIKPVTSCRTRFSQYRIMTLYSLYLFEIITYVRRNLSEFGRRTGGPTRQLRNTGRLKSVPRRTTLAESNPRVIGPTYYEHLPTDLRNETNDETFDRRLKNFLLDNEFYSVDEFLTKSFEVPT